MIFSVSLAVLLTAIILIVSILSAAPSDFPGGTIVSIKKDMTTSQTADILKQAGIIRSALLFKIYVKLTDAGKGVRVGDYLFDQPQSALRVAYRAAYGIQGLDKVKVTILEGMTSEDIASLLAKNIKGFDAKGFLALVKDKEGYLFPDTYYFNPNATPQEVLSEIGPVFDRKMTLVSSEITAYGKPLKDVLTMASIIEKEATSTIDRQIIAGVLWKRIAAKMPLQVDPPFFYFLNKISSQLTLDDLKVKSPYNTYLNQGLPPTPIDNPGLDAILAAVRPKDSKYWFYLSDKKGNMHYAETNDEHNANKAKYL